MLWIKQNVKRSQSIISNYCKEKKYFDFYNAHSESKAQAM